MTAVVFALVNFLENSHIKHNIFSISLNTFSYRSLCTIRRQKAESLIYVLRFSVFNVFYFLIGLNSLRHWENISQNSHIYHTVSTVIYITTTTAYLSKLRRRYQYINILFLRSAFFPVLRLDFTSHHFLLWDLRWMPLHTFSHCVSLASLQPDCVL